MSAGRSPIDPQSVSRLRDAAIRLAAALDRARLYQAAAYASMAADSILRQARDDPSTGSGRAGRSGGNSVPDATGVDLDFTLVLRQAQDDRLVEQRGIDLDFTLDEQGRVWMIREGDCYILGRTDPVCAEMRRFLAGVASGGDGYS